MARSETREDAREEAVAVALTAVDSECTRENCALHYNHMAQAALAAADEWDAEHKHGEWCIVCGDTNRRRVRVHVECIIHKHVELEGIGESAIPRRQEEWAGLYNERERWGALLDRCERVLDDVAAGQIRQDAVKAEVRATLAEIRADTGKENAR